MNKKRLYHYQEAFDLYAEQLLSLEAISKRLPVSLRTLNNWAKNDDWKTKRDECQRHFELIYNDNKKIAIELGKLIKKQLAKNDEPSATILNAWSRASSLSLNFKKFDTEQDDKQESTDQQDKRSAKEILKELDL